TEQKVYPQQVRNGIQFFVEELAFQLKEISEKCAVEFEEKLYQKIVEILRKHLGNGVDAILIINSVNSVIAGLADPKFALEYDALKNLSSGTVLCNSEAIRFMEDAKHSLLTLKSAAANYIYNFMGGLCSEMPVSIAGTIFKDIQERIEELEAQVDNALFTLDRLERMQNDLENM
ncbi:MAG: hypothetical protein KDI39_16780, partial [Pseudomonadales bacterium]|nr:hypothetical protein [Pseudomonadales bacterium]